MSLYLPESPWNLPPTTAQIRAVMKAGRILHRDITENDLPPTRWQMRDLQFDLWAEVRSQGKEKKADCQVIKEHDDGDLTMKCSEQQYMITTEGEVFQEILFDVFDIEE